MLGRQLWGKKRGKSHDLPWCSLSMLMLNAAIIRLGIGEGKDKKVMSGCQEVSRKSESDRKQLRPTPHCVNGLSYLAQTWLLSES